MKQQAIVHHFSNASENICFSSRVIFPLGSPVKLGYHVLLLVKKGRYKATVGIHEFELTTGDYSLLNANVLVTLEETMPSEILCICFSTDFLYKSHVREHVIDDLLDIHPEYPPVYPLDLPVFKNVRQKFEAIKSELDRQSAFHLNIIRLKLIELLYEYNRACEYCLLKFNKRMNRQFQIAYTFRQLVEKHFNDWRNVSDYATAMNMSAKHLSESVKEETGKTALEIIHDRLLLEIQYLLKNTEHSIKEIAYQAGFDNTSHFSRFFKSKTETTPADYRSNP
ncbi:MAG: AraC family transcriptional regulator [Filimonas sp.]|nr:AraC family transcriptional regulator [Filimonas sp.]